MVRDRAQTIACSMVRAWLSHDIAVVDSLCDAVARCTRA